MHTCTCPSTSRELQMYIQRRVCIRLCGCSRQQLCTYVDLLTHMSISGLRACVLSRWVYIYPCNHCLEDVTLSKFPSLWESWLCHLYHNNKPCHLGLLWGLCVKQDVKPSILWLVHNKCSISISFPYLHMRTLTYTCAYLQSCKSTRIFIKY